MSIWDSTADEVRVSVRNIDVIFKKGKENQIGVMIYKQGDVDPRSITIIPMEEGESDDVEHG